MKNRYKNACIQVIDFLEKIEEENDIKYYLVGGLLVSLYSEPRSTTDIDFIVDIFTVNRDVNSYIELLEENDFFPIQDWENAVILAKDTHLLQYLDKQERVKIDNYILIEKTSNKYKKMGPLGIKRRVRAEILNKECWIASKEDFILSKLVFGGYQDFADALGCWLRFSDNLDLNYLLKNSEFLGVQKEYNLLLSGIDDPDEFFEALFKS